MSKAFFDERSGRIIIKGIKIKPGQMDLKFRNFSGKETDKNRAGSRNFCVVISEEDKKTIEAAVKQAGMELNIKEWDGEYYFKILVSYYKVPPRVERVKYNSNGQAIKTAFDESNIGNLDNILIADASLSCSPSYVTKYKAWACYLNTLSFTPLVDPVEEELDAIDFGSPEEDECPFE